MGADSCMMATLLVQKPFQDDHIFQKPCMQSVKSNVELMSVEMRGKLPDQNCNVLPLVRQFICHAFAKTQCQAVFYAPVRMGDFKSLTSE